MRANILTLTFVCLLPCVALAQQTQAQAGASAQGNASVQQSNGAQTSPTSASGNGSAAAAVGGASSQPTQAQPTHAPKTGPAPRPGKSDTAKADQPANVDAGTTINAVLSGAVDASRSKPGDPVKAQTVEAVKSGGDVIIPRGTTLVGHVTQAQAAGKGEGQSTLGVAFDRAVLRDGREIPLDATIRALAAAESSANIGGAEPMGGMAGAGSTGGGAVRGGGLLGGGGTLGGTLGAAGHVAGSAVGGAGAAVGGTAEVLKASPGSTGGIDAHGLLSSSSQGVFGLRNVTLQQSAAGAASGSGSVVASSRTVHLDRGTRMLLAAGGSATAGGAAAMSSGTTGSASSKSPPPAKNTADNKPDKR